MSALTEIISAVKLLGIPAETGIFSGMPPDEYIVLTPLIDRLDLYADNMPHNKVEEVRLSLFSNNNYLRIKDQLLKVLLGAGFTITEGRYIGFENDTKYHHYALDIMKEYEMEEL